MSLARKWWGRLPSGIVGKAPFPTLSSGRVEKLPLSCCGRAEGPWLSCPGICGHDAEAGGPGLERFYKLCMCKSPCEVGDALLPGLRDFASRRGLCAEPGGLVVNESASALCVLGRPSRKASVLLNGLMVRTDTGRKPQNGGFTSLPPLVPGPARHLLKTHLPLPRCRPWAGPGRSPQWMALPACLRGDNCPSRSSVGSGGMGT